MLNRAKRLAHWAVYWKGRRAEHDDKFLVYCGRTNAEESEY